jgi:hypothetical protein
VLLDGSGVNPMLLANLSLPKIGSTWSCEIDASAHAGATLATLQGRKREHPGRPTPWGELLIDMSSRRVFATTRVPDIAGHARFDFPVPYDLSIVGSELTVQGGILGGGGELLNAIRLVIGF